VTTDLISTRRGIIIDKGIPLGTFHLEPIMTLRRVAYFAVLTILSVVAQASAERAPEDRGKSTHVVVGKVEGVYMREEGDTRYYVVEIGVEKAEKGDNLKAGDTIYVRCYLWTPDFYKGKKLTAAEEKNLGFRGAAYDGVPKEGERVRVFSRFREGKHEAAYPSWYDSANDK
jgi:hypothetical protein